MISKPRFVSIFLSSEETIESKLKSDNIDWDSVVKVSTGHFVFPALYCNLKRANFLQYLPEELVNYMIHITDLNHEGHGTFSSEISEIFTLSKNTTGLL